VVRRVSGLLLLRQSEVDDLGVPAPVDEDVPGLQVAMQDLASVQSSERLADLRADAQDLVQRYRAAPQFLAEVLALDDLHGVEDDVAFAPDIVDVSQMRVADRRGRPGLALEAPQSIGVLSELGRQDLECHVAVQARVARAVNLGHAALAEQAGDLVVVADQADLRDPEERWE
jgi:hypothetical protein